MKSSMSKINFPIEPKKTGGELERKIKENECDKTIKHF